MKLRWNKKQCEDYSTAVTKVTGEEEQEWLVAWREEPRSLEEVLEETSVRCSDGWRKLQEFEKQAIATELGFEL